MAVYITKASEHKQLPNGSYCSYICVDFPGRTTYVEINKRNELELENPHWDFLSHFYPLSKEDIAFFRSHKDEIAKALKTSNNLKIEGGINE